MAAFSYCTLGSGSSGNSLAIWDDQSLFLVDAGFSGRELKKRMNEAGLDIDNITAVLVSHDHSDHVKGAGILSRRYNVPVYATRRVLDGGFLRSQKLNGAAEIHPGCKFSLGKFDIRAFEVPHDATQTVGFRIENNEMAMAVATDIGHVPARVIPSLEDCDALVFESNHDIEMLRTGPYPEHLKRRILSENGHLPNVESGETLARVIGKRTKHVTLAHLSEENNTPEVALKTVKAILSRRKINGVKVIPASQSEIGDWVEL